MWLQIKPKLWVLHKSHNMLFTVFSFDQSRGNIYTLSWLNQCWWYFERIFLWFVLYKMPFLPTCMKIVFGLSSTSKGIIKWLNFVLFPLLKDLKNVFPLSSSFLNCFFWNNLDLMIFRTIKAKKFIYCTNGTVTGTKFLLQLSMMYIVTFCLFHYN